jgi:hypothetical protein
VKQHGSIFGGNRRRGSTSGRDRKNTGASVEVFDAPAEFAGKNRMSFCRFCGLTWLVTNLVKREVP